MTVGVTVNAGDSLASIELQLAIGEKRSAWAASATGSMQVPVGFLVILAGCHRVTFQLAARVERTHSVNTGRLITNQKLIRRKANLALSALRICPICQRTCNASTQKGSNAKAAANRSRVAHKATCELMRGLRNDSDARRTGCLPVPWRARFRDSATGNEVRLSTSTSEATGQPYRTTPGCLPPGWRHD